jgi:hypothetical protein
MTSGGVYSAISAHDPDVSSNASTSLSRASLLNFIIDLHRCTTLSTTQRHQAINLISGICGVFPLVSYRRSRMSGGVRPPMDCKTDNSNKVISDAYHFDAL